MILNEQSLFIKLKRLLELTNVWMLPTPEPSDTILTCSSGTTTLG